MKDLKNKKSVLIIAVAVVLILVGVVLLFTVNNNVFGNKNEENTAVDDGPIDPDDDIVIDDNKLPFSKADAISLIYQDKTVNNDNESWYVGDAAVIAHNADNTIFLVHYKKVLSDGKVEELETVVTLSETEKKIENPAWPVGSKSLNDYYFINYEGTEDFDPANHQYQANVGWDSSNSYTPDPEKGW